MSTTRRRPRLAGAGSFVVLQVICCLILGMAMMTSPTVGVVGLTAWFGLYWLWRTIGTLSHTLLTTPHRWAERGLVVVANFTAAVVALQAPILDLFSVGPAVIVFLGLQSVMAGGIELIVAHRGSGPAGAFLGLVNVGLGAMLLSAFVTTIALPVGLVGWSITVAGLLAGYAFVTLPVPWTSGPNARIEQ